MWILNTKQDSWLTSKSWTFISFSLSEKYVDGLEMIALRNLMKSRGS